MTRPALLLPLCCLLALLTPAAAEATPPGMARIPGGRLAPQFSSGGGAVSVHAFALDRYPVTRAEYLAFVRAHPRWRRGQLPRALAGSGYLAEWPGALDAGSGEDLRRPVTEVSWFAARGYCAAEGKRLPTTAEWELAAQASESSADASRDAAFTARLLRLYTRRSGPPGPVGSTFRNAFGVYDLHGLVWEWTLDFNNLLVSDDSRATGARDHALFCAAGVIGARDPANYPAFMRYGVRAALEGRTTAGGLGFRCAQDL
jgi:sulfatase modifying factor 1